MALRGIAGENFTSVTITGGSINGTVIGDQTPAAGSFTTLNSTGTTKLATASGNVACGLPTPSIYNVGTALEIGQLGSSAFAYNGDFYLTNNLYYNNGFKYARAGAGASLIDVGASEILLKTAPTGTNAGDTATLTIIVDILPTGAAVTGTLAVSGAITIGNTVSAGIAVASTNKIAIVVGGTTYYFLATTTP